MAKETNDIKILTLSIFILLTIIEAPNAASLKNNNSNKNEDEYPGLYSLSDRLEILTADNFYKKLYNKEHAWLIEFYSSWCGHCQRFAPYWKSFAESVANWTDIVKVGAIDCAQEKNTEICRQFEIMGYPTVRYFHENLNAESKSIGKAMKTAGDIIFLKEHLLELLKTEQKEERFKQASSLLPYNGSEISGLWKNVGEKSFIFVVVEELNDTLGSEVILDLHYAKDVVIKIVKTTQTSLVKSLNVAQIPSLLALSKDLSVIPITPRDKTKNGIKNAIRIYCESKGITLPTSKIPVFNQDLIKLDNNFKYLDDQLKKMTNITFQVDLENAIHHSLTREIVTKKVVDGEKFTTLLDYLKLLIKYVPLSDNGIKFLTDLRSKIEQHKNEVSGDEISKYIKELEKLYSPVYSQPLQWLGCRGSSPQKRGYPCGVWKLFHFLTVRAAEVGGDENNDVLVIMHAYIKNYFGCTHCSQHFQEMASRRNIFDVNGFNQSILWLWEAHNEVNERLAGDETEDPHFPKIQYPDVQSCPQCRISDGSWNRTEVLEFLKRVYSVNNVKKYMPEFLTESVNNVTSAASRASRGFISSFDVSLYMLLYVCSAGMLVLIIKIFLRKKYRKKIYMHDVLGKV